MWYHGTPPRYALWNITLTRMRMPVGVAIRAILINRDLLEAPRGNLMDIEMAVARRKSLLLKRYRDFNAK